MSRTIRNTKNACWIRFPKTFGEVRDSEGCRVDGFGKRKKRSKRYLPSSWDDRPVAALKEKVRKKLDRR